jgi:ethanolaminephosphotransferase
MFGGKYVSDAAVANLRSYKYVGTDHSLLARHVFQPFWSRVVYLLPYNMAPNMVTLVGWLGMLLGYALVVVYCPTLTEAAPSWVYYLLAALMFLYQTLDAIDGKQARRLEMASPLGELFDHGCDALTTMLVSLCTAAALQLGSGPLFFVLATLGYVSFYMAQWEEYHTHVMELGLIGVTEANTGYMIMMCLSGYFGPQFWSQSLQVGSYNILYKHAFIGVVICGAIVALLENLKRVAPTLRGASSVIASAKWAFPGLIIHIVSLVLYLRHPRVFESHVNEYVLLFGILTANAVGRVILARVTRDQFDVFPVIIWPLPLLLLNARFGWVSAGVALHAYLALAVLHHLYWALSIIFELRVALNTQAMFVPEAKAKAARERETKR